MGDSLQPWHLHWLTNIEYNRVDLVKEGANSQAHIKLFKNKGGESMKLADILKMLKPEHVEVIEKTLKDKDDEIEKAKQSTTATQADNKDKAASFDETDTNDSVTGGKNKAGVMKTAGSDNTEEILKSISDPALRELLQTQISKAAAAESIAKTLMEEREESEAIAKAKEVPALGAEEATLAGIYKKLKRVDAQLCEDVFGIFKAANALASQGGAFTSIGKGIDGAAGDGGVSEEAAWGKIETAAAEIAKSRNMSQEAAVRVIMKEKPELYQAYTQAQRG